MEKIEAPEQGIYHNVPAEEYFAWDAMNQSTLGWAAYSMEHLRAALDGGLEFKNTDAKQLGSAVHCRILEPDLFSERYVVSPGCEAPLKSGPNKGKPCGLRASVVGLNGKFYCMKHAPEDAEPSDNMLTAEQFDLVESMNEKVRAHKVVKLIRQHGGFECCVVWEKDGMKCKARLDKYITDSTCPNTILDLKKVMLCGGDDRSFSKSVANYAYHRQAAWYSEAVQAIHGIEPLYIWVVVEEKPPHCVNVIHCDAETMAIGRYANNQLWERYRLSLETGNWPGYATDIHLGGLPDWERRSYQGLLDG